MLETNIVKKRIDAVRSALGSLNAKTVPDCMAELYSSYSYNRIMRRREYIEDDLSLMSLDLEFRTSILKLTQTICGLDSQIAELLPNEPKNVYKTFKDNNEELKMQSDIIKSTEKLLAYIGSVRDKYESGKELFDALLLKVKQSINEKTNLNDDIFDYYYLHPAFERITQGIHRPKSVDDLLTYKEILIIESSIGEKYSKQELVNGGIYAQMILRDFYKTGNLDPKYKDNCAKAIERIESIVANYYKQ